MTTQDHSTEEKIKAAARELFHQKGYDGTKTRDIADAAGINLALLNYYFRSKKKLFDLIMLETIETFFKSVVEIIREEELSMNQKLHKLAAHYIQMLQDEPDLPIFILSEMRSNPATITEHLFQDTHIRELPFFQHLNQSLQQDTGNPQNPIQVLLNFISMTVFPFAAKPLIKEIFALEDNQFRDLMDERKELIPLWIHKLMSPEPHSK